VLQLEQARLSPVADGIAESSFPRVHSRMTKSRNFSHGGFDARRASSPYSLSGDVTAVSRGERNGRAGFS